MMKNLLLLIALVGTIAIAYSIGKKEDKAQVNDLKSQMKSLKSQMTQQGKSLENSYRQLHRSLNLHLVETSIESATHDTLDHNFGEAERAVNVAKNYLKGAVGNRVSRSDVDDLSKMLDRASSLLLRLDRGALQPLNAADQKTRELILKNSR